jgi:hypothetical protein
MNLIALTPSQIKDRTDALTDLAYRQAGHTDHADNFLTSNIGL